MGAPKLIDMETLYGNLILEPLRGSVNWQRICVVESEIPSEVFRLALNYDSAHVVQTKNPYFANDLNTAALFAKDKDAFSRAPLSAILAPDRCDEKSETELKIFEQTFTSSIEKPQILINAESALNGLSIAGSLIADIIVIVDEMITNAVYNAPFVDLQNTNSGPRHRQNEVHMPSGKSARIFIGADKDRIAIGCKDLYGTLNVSKLFARIKNCYDTSVGDNINFSGAGGAGIGSYMIFNSSASYFAEVKIETHTIVCCTVPIRMSSRGRQKIVKNLHFSTYK